jgi:hypothetical protein
MPAFAISYSEMHDGQKPTHAQLSELIRHFKTDPTFMSLAMWSLMISLFERNREKGRALQWFFIENLIPTNLKDRVERAAALDSDSPRPVFGRWQMLAVMKRLLIETTNEGVKDPRHDDAARRELGNACLMMNDLLFPPEQDERLNAAAGDRERVGDELMAQMLFQFELYYPPDVYQAVARNNEYFRIFHSDSHEFQFSDQYTFPKKFKLLTGLELPRYLELYFSIWVLHNNLQKMYPGEINENPAIINFDKEQIFALMNLSDDEQDVFFRTVLSDLDVLTKGVARDGNSNRQWEFDYTTFRDHPLVYNTDLRRGFTCIAYPFLIEKLSSGVYHTILNSWPEQNADRARFQSYWGRVFEQFTNDRIRDEYPESQLANRFYANPYFEERQSGSLVEVCDAVLDYGDTLVLLEHKGGYLSLDEKYSGDVSKLLGGVTAKFGRATKQLSRSIERLFNEDATKRQSFAQLADNGERRLGLSADDLKRIRTVYPVLIVQEFAMTIGFMNRRLRVQMVEAVNKSKVDPAVRVRPL